MVGSSGQTHLLLSATEDLKTPSNQFQQCLDAEATAQQSDHLLDCEASLFAEYGEFGYRFLKVW